MLPVGPGGLGLQAETDLRGKGVGGGRRAGKKKEPLEERPELRGQVRPVLSPSRDRGSCDT